jgi:hypothetical protein
MSESKYYITDTLKESLQMPQCTPMQHNNKGIEKEKKESQCSKRSNESGVYGNKEKNIVEPK